MSVVPALIVALVWIGLAATRRHELGRITLWPEMVLATLSASMGVYGLKHVADLQQRSFLDYGFERLASKVAFLALTGAIIWLVRARIIYSWVIFTTCLADTVLWVLTLATL